jgi:hypothetical protein
MKKSLVIFIAIVLYSAFYGHRYTYCQELKWQWARTVHAVSDILPNDVAGDGDDNVIICFDNRNGRFFIENDTIYGKGDVDIILAKYNSLGTLEWVKSPGGTGKENVSSLCTDSSNNIYIIGSHSTTSIAFDTDTLQPRSGSEVYLAKYAPNGSIVWAKNIRGPGEERGRIIRYDNNGSIIAVWQSIINSYVNFENDSFFVSGGQCITKFSTNGEIEWTTSTQGINIYFMCTSKNGNITVGGYTTGFFIVNNDTINTEKSKYLILCTFDSNGNLKWRSQSEGQHILGVTVDTSNNVYTIGDYQKKANIFGIELSQYEDLTYYFVASLDSNGNTRWAKGLANSGDVSAFNLSLSNSQKLLISGRSFGGPVDFGNNLKFNEKPNQMDCFIASYQTNGIVERVEPTILEIWSMVYNNPSSLIIAGRLDRTQFLGDIEVKEEYNSNTSFVAKAKDEKFSAVMRSISSNNKTYSACYHPTSEELTLHSNAPIQYPLTVKVYDLLGKMVKSSTFTSGDAKKLTIRAADLISGAYSLEIISEQQSASSKVMVVK